MKKIILPRKRREERQDQVKRIRERFEKGNMDMYPFIRQNGTNLYSEPGGSPCSGLIEDIFCHGGIKFVDAKYETIYSYHNVIVRIPKTSEFKKVQKHFIAVPSDINLKIDPDILLVPKHFSQTLLFKKDAQTNPSEKVKVYRNFFTDKYLPAGHYVCSIEIQIKYDYQTGQETLIINYRKFSKGESKAADYMMKIGVTEIPGDHDQIGIPKTALYVRFTSNR